MKKIISLIVLLLIPISVSCLEIVKPEDIKFDNENIYGESRELMLREDINVYSSPSSEDIVTKVKEGNKFVFKYLSNDRAYIDNGKIKGWLDLKNKDYIVESLDTYLVVKKMKLVCGSIPANTLIEKPYAKNLMETKLLISYEGCSEVVNMIGNDAIISMTQYNYMGDYIWLKKEYKMYEEANSSSNVIDTIPRSAIIKKIVYVYNIQEEGNDLKVSIPEDEVKIYVEYKGKKGWILVKPNDYQDFTDEKSANDARKKNTIIKIVLDTLLIVILIGILIIRAKKRNKKEE